MPRGGAASTCEKPADRVERRARREVESKVPMAKPHPGMLVNGLVGKDSSGLAGRHRIWPGVAATSLL